MQEVTWANWFFEYERRRKSFTCTFRNFTICSSSTRVAILISQSQPKRSQRLIEAASPHESFEIRKDVTTNSHEVLVDNKNLDCRSETWCRSSRSLSVETSTWASFNIVGNKKQVAKSAQIHKKKVPPKRKEKKRKSILEQCTVH